MLETYFTEGLDPRYSTAMGRNIDFWELLQKRDIEAIKQKMDCRQIKTADAISDYNPAMHSVMRREDKVIKDKKGNYKRTIKRWKLPINYPAYINEISLVFLYGRPVKWGQESEGTDNAYGKFLNVLKRTHFNAKVRQCKRFAGAETQSAMLFHVFRTKENKPDVQIRVLAKSKGDTIYARWDIYENLTAVGWEYDEYDGQTNVRHFNLYTPEVIFRCTMNKDGWEVVPEENIIGKIPVILFLQEKEWAGVEPQIEREEYISSRTADTNDYFADPQQVMNADIIKNMPEKDDENKTLVVKGDVKASDALSYVTWDNASQSKKDEVAQLQNHILSKTFTPNIDFDNMKSLSNVTGKALKQMMILANIKAQKHQETHDELMDRTASLIRSIIANVLDVSLASECANLEITHEFQEPFGEDIAESLQNLSTAVDSQFLSKESAMEMSPLTKNAQIENQRIRKEQEEAESAQRDIFTQLRNQAEGIDEGGNAGAE